MSSEQKNKFISMALEDFAAGREHKMRKEMCNKRGRHT